MKKLKLLLILPILLLSSCEEEGVGVHYEDSSGIVHIACVSARVVNGGTLRIRKSDGEIIFIKGNYVCYSLPDCPICDAGGK